MSGNVTFSYSHQYPYVPTNGKESVFVLFEFKAAKAKKLNRFPINLSLVLDRSGSMSGKPLQYCKEASKFVINQLSGQDVMNVVIFDDQVETVFPPQHVTNKDFLKNKVDSIATRGMTNLSGGLMAGSQNIMKQATENYVNRVILLSDGLANVGITSYERLKKLAEEYNTAGTIITTMGVSKHFDEELMEGIADAGKGNFHFIDKVEKIPDIFAEELEGLLSVVAQNLSLTIKPAEGVVVDRVYGYEPKESEAGIEVRLGDIYAEETKSLLLECKIPPHGEGINNIFHIECSFVDVTDGLNHYNFQNEVPIHYTSDIEKLSKASNKMVDHQVEITKSAQILEKAILLFDEGNIEKGKNLLYSSAINLQNRANELGDEELLEESESILEKLADFDYSKQTRKTLHAEKYRQMKRKKRS